MTEHVKLCCPCCQKPYPRPEPLSPAQVRDNARARKRMYERAGIPPHVYNHGYGGGYSEPSTVDMGESAFRECGK